MLSSNHARFQAGVFFLAIILLLGGCATPQTQALLERPNALPAQAEIASTPFYAQEAYQCGPASLAMALNAAGITVSAEQLIPYVYLPDRQGSLQVEMLAATRRHGLIAYQLSPDLKDMLTEIAAGTPVIVLQNLAFNWYPKWHYAVAVGYNLNTRHIILRSGLEPRQILPLDTFERTWSRGGHWAMVAVPPQQIPQTAIEDRFINSVAALEKGGALKQAKEGYEAALKRWPTNGTAQIGLGNTAYAMGDLTQAESAFRQATLSSPNSAAAFNNLAQTLADLGRNNEALQAARQAVALGGPFHETALKTLENISHKNTLPLKNR